MEKLYELLDIIRKLPKLYLGKPSLECLGAFISGYISCMDVEDTNGHFDFYPGFHEFIEQKYNVKLAKSSIEIIDFFSSSEKEAFYKFFELLDGFLEKSNK